MNWSCWIAVACALLPATAAPAQDGRDDDAEIGRELAELYRSDQSDQDRWQELGDAELARRQAERRERVAEIVTRGQLGTPVDYHHASWLLQHGDGVDDFLMAHVLATTASFEGHREAFFMVAAALDRFLLDVGQPQRFGSQFFDEAGTDMGDSAQLLSQRIVREFLGGSTGLNGRPVEPGASTPKALKAARSFLKKTAKRAPKLAAGTAPKKVEAWREALARTLEIVHSGSLEAPDDFYHAGVILSHGDGAETALLAHVLATAAGLLEHEAARVLYVRTLDAHMLALGRHPLFADELPDGVELPPRPPILELHPDVRARIVGKRRR